MVAIAAIVFASIATPTVPTNASKDSKRTPSAPGAPILEIDHLMIHVAPNAPERVALEQAGFRIAPEVNRHDGQGSASITVEFQNSFLELTWRDDSVSVAPGLEAVARRFQKQGEWRTSGWSPFGIGLRRVAGAPDSLPFPTRAIRAEWMRPGAKLEIISAMSDSLGPRLWVVPAMMAADSGMASESERERESKSETFVHDIGVRRITAVKVIAPARGLTPATDLVARVSPVKFVRGRAWLLDVTFDRGAGGKIRDLRPALPLRIHY